VTVWVDEQLPPQLAAWLSSEFEVSAIAVRALGLQAAADAEIFFAARQAGAVVITKDQDFVRLLQSHGPPPRILWVTCGNTSTVRLQQVFARSFGAALNLLAKGEALIEISDAR
jgi:predicted nuclease of predicted toxin-antitoxin system